MTFLKHPKRQRKKLRTSSGRGLADSFLLVILGWLRFALDTLGSWRLIACGRLFAQQSPGFFRFCLGGLVFFTSLKLCHFTLGSCWTWLLLLAIGSAFLYWRDQKSLKAIYLKHKQSWLVQEGAFALAFLAFTLVKIYIPNIHDPVGEGYNGGGGSGEWILGFWPQWFGGETISTPEIHVDGRAADWL